MTAHQRISVRPAEAAVIEEALSAMGASELRRLLLDLTSWLDPSMRGQLVNTVVDRAARNRSGWVPAGPTAEAIAEIVGFAEGAAHGGSAAPSRVDAYLQQGSNAFLAKDYGAAFQIFRALLVPMARGDLYLGQDELVDEVLGSDVYACAAQYVIAMYMTATARHRGQAVLLAVDQVRDLGNFWEPLQEMERVAVEPLPEFSAFLAQWRVLVEQRVAKERDQRSDWDTEKNRWLREVIVRMEGADGLAKLARTTRRAEDLRAWCQAHLDAKHWAAALAAYDEAAELVTDEFHLGEFHDGGALAAQELRREDLPDRLRDAWRVAPHMVRLRRWLGSSTTKHMLRQRATEALEVCPKESHRQLAFLHILLDDIESAAKLLASAPGLGWSRDEHPGPLVFPLFCQLLGDVSSRAAETGHLDEGRLGFGCEQEGLRTPDVSALIRLADVAALSGPEARTTVVAAMRKAAENRIEGVVEHKRRRHYGHAASLALRCVQLDPSPGAVSWLATLRSVYRGYPALQREFG